MTPFLPSRRRVLQGAAAVAATSLLPAGARATASPIELVAREAEVQLGEADAPVTRAWTYDGAAPGRVIRARQGDTLGVRLINRLPQPTTVHWHGIRIDNAMDGVSGLTQAPVEPGGNFDYRVRLPDAGTFWFHPHHRSWEQVARGLYGLLVVEEETPAPVDRDLAFVADDWRLDNDWQIDEASLGHMMDWSHAGRLGNWLTVNGRSRPEIAVDAGERIRLRVANTANARVLNFAFAPHAPVLIALDGQPVPPAPLPDARLTLAPGQRADLAIDMTEAPDSRVAVQEVSYETAVTAAHFVYGATARRAADALPPVAPLANNPLDGRLALADAVHADLVMEGGAMGRLREAVYEGRSLGLRELVGKGKAWAFNGVAGMTETPLLRADRGRTVTIKITNATAWPHAMHLHGHHFRVVARNGQPVPGGPWRDTELLQREETATLAFVADNPGKWMLHCHMLEHQAAGMGTWIEVA